MLDHTTLYAKWVDYHEPSKITIIIPEDAELNTNGKYEITVAYVQGAVEGDGDLIKVDFGDGIYYTEADLTKSPAQLVYEYDTPGEKVIKIYGNNKGYTLGGGYNYPVVAPSSYVVDAVLAWDLAKIADYAFRGANITVAPLSDYVSIIGIGAFASCRKLQKLTLPNSILEIRDNAFEACEALQGSVTLPTSLTVLGNYVFNRCQALEQVNFDCINLHSLGD